MARNLKTNVASPWALIFRNGDTPGKRRSTRMAYLTNVYAENGKVTHYAGPRVVAVGAIITVVGTAAIVAFYHAATWALAQ